MAQFLVAALIAAGAASVQVQSTPSVPVQPFVDSPEQRRDLRNLSACLAEARPRWARQTLAQPYLSEEQATLVARALTGTDTCLRGRDAAYTFRTSTMVGSLAEHFLRAEVGRADFARVTTALATMRPSNSSEDFALCVAARAPGAARDLALSEPGTPAETQASRQVSAFVDDCVDPGERLTVDMQSLRSLLSTVLYRGTVVSLATN